MRVSSTAAGAVRGRGAAVKCVATIVDRLEGAAANLKKEGLDREAVVTSKDLLGR
jgi:orotate phosphoribosyltransferase